MDEVSIEEVGILGDHDRILLVREFRNGGVAGPVSLRQFHGVGRLVPEFNQANGQEAG